MPFIGLGLHVLVALFFAIHVVRSGQPIYWLFILFSFPLLGSIVYFVVIYLPGSRIDYGARKAVTAAGKALDPTRELREAREAYDFTPTAQNRMRLAAALLDAGDAGEAASHYEACLAGPFAADLEIRLAAARAHAAAGEPAAALARLEETRRANADFRAESVALLTAQSLASVGRDDDAKREFESAVARFGSFESRAEFAIWAADRGDGATVEQLLPALREAFGRWSGHTRDINKPLLRRLETSLQKVGARLSR